MNRKELDALVAHHQLTRQEVEHALTLAHARPTRADASRFLVRSLLLAGVLSLAAGLVFFVAANWDALRVVGRFVLLEALLVGSIALTLWRPPPLAVGRYAVLAAFIITGTLLALFGQTYQTGANVYELFLTWAVLGLPFVFTGQWSVLWTAWVLVLNVALALFCGWMPEGGLLWQLAWAIFSRPLWSTSLLLMFAATVNLTLYAFSEWLHTRGSERFAPHVPPNWLRRFAIACAFAFATWAGSLAILGDGYLAGGFTGADALTLVWLAMMLIGVGVYTLRRRVDVFPLALIAACVILLGMLAIARHGSFDDLGNFFLLALWLVVSSTVLGRVLMKLVRSWRDSAAEA